MSNRSTLASEAPCVTSSSMVPPLAQLNIRNIPRATLTRLKMAAAAEHRSIKALVLELIHAKLTQLARQGRLPRR